MPPARCRILLLETRPSVVVQCDVSGILANFEWQGSEAFNFLSYSLPIRIAGATERITTEVIHDALASLKDMTEDDK